MAQGHAVYITVGGIILLESLPLCYFLRYFPQISRYTLEIIKVRRCLQARISRNSAVSPPARLRRGINLRFRRVVVDSVAQAKLTELS